METLEEGVSHPSRKLQLLFYYGRVWAHPNNEVINNAVLVTMVLLSYRMVGASLIMYRTQPTLQTTALLTHNSQWQMEGSGATRLVML